MYFIKPPGFLKRLYPKGLIWEIPEDGTPAVYITFDDGPHPEATPYVLEQLSVYDAKATFFCIGKNVVEYPAIYEQILQAGHRTGNHTHTHINGWKSRTAKYLDNVASAAYFIDSKLFRPPYGRISYMQATRLMAKDYRIYMWDVLSADFDTKLTPEKCWEYVALHLRPGSILVFHDSAKAWDRMRYALPRTLAFCKQKGWDMRVLP